MAAKSLRLRYLGDDVLRKKAHKIAVVDLRVQQIIQKMFELMDEAEGVGLAAPQIGISERIITVDTHENNERFALVNPRVIWRSSTQEPFLEGCLSVPEVFGEVCRPTDIEVEGVSDDGRPTKLRVGGLLARVIQHEIDHLDGKLFIDHLSSEQKSELAEQIETIHQFSPNRRKQAPSVSSKSC